MTDLSLRLIEHTNISAMNIEIWSFSACVFLMYREKIKIYYRCIRIKNNKITEKGREKIRLWIDKLLGEHWQRKRKLETRKEKEYRQNTVTVEYPEVWISAERWEVSDFLYFTVRTISLEMWKLPRCQLGLLKSSCEVFYSIFFSQMCL